MEPDDSPTSSALKCCDCGCSCSALNRSFSGTYLRSVKRKFDELEEKIGFSSPGYARIDVENECHLLREMVGTQQLTIQELATELEEERNASASATNEAMSMILRLQREKAEAEMEARQFKRFAEERMEHDQQEIMALEDLLYKREETIESLLYEVKLCKQRMTYGFTEADAHGFNGEKTMSRDSSMSEELEGQLEFSHEIYPLLTCKTNEPKIFICSGDSESADAEKYEGSSHSEDQLKDLEYRINQLEKSPRIVHPDNEEFGIKKSKKFSSESDSLTPPVIIIIEEMGAEFPSAPEKPDNSLQRAEPAISDNPSEGGDDVSDRVYTIDSIHQGDSGSGAMNLRVSGDDYKTISRGSSVGDLEIQKLYARLQALEADRETMRQTIMSMGTDKAQLVLLREIAQNLCKDMSPSSRGKQQSLKRTTCRWTSLFKWVASFLIWRSKARRCRYMFGLSDHCIGLQMLLDRRPCTRHSAMVLRTSL